MRAQADSLERARAHHQRQAEELRAEIIDLRVLADRLERSPLRVVEPAPEPTPKREGSYARKVRDAAVRLVEFDTDTIKRELPEVAPATVGRWLRELEARGVLTSVRQGTRKLYHYEAPSGPTPARRRHATPESEARVSTRRQGTAIAGTGRSRRAAGAVVNELLRDVKPYGVEVTTSAHRFEFRRDGVIIATCSKTPGASSLKGTRSELRRAGVPV